MAKRKLLSIVLVIAVTVGCDSQNNDALLVQVQAAQGTALPGNSQPANFLIIITDHLSGAPITDLDQPNFTVINHFSVPGQACGFSNNIISFNNVGTGAYHIQVGLLAGTGCTWAQGDHLAQVIVTAGSRKGQAAATLAIQ